MAKEKAAEEEDDDIMRAARVYGSSTTELAKINANKEIELAKIREAVRRRRHQTFRYVLLGLAILIALGRQHHRLQRICPGRTGPGSENGDGVRPARQEVVRV